MRSVFLVCSMGLGLMLLAGCNLFDNKLQGQIGASGGGGPDKPALEDRIGIASEQPEYIFDEGTSQRLKFILTKAVKDATTLNWRVDGGADDFSHASGTVAIASGESAFELDLTTLNDGLYEGDEDFNLTIDVDPDFFVTTVVVPLKITEAAATAPQVSFALSTKTLREDAGTFSLTANLSQASASLIRVKLAHSGSATYGSDYEISPAQDLVFGPGQTSRPVVLTIKDDAISGESIEDAIITMDEVVIGKAQIDPANKQFVLLIEDNDAGASLIEIKGVTGGADATQDGYLTAGHHATVNWAAPLLNDETGFEITIFEMDGQTVRCPSLSVGSNFTSAAFAACALNEGGSYKISVVANRLDGSTLAAGNNMSVFTVDTLPPAAFHILGVMGGNDIVPDSFLAGALQPTAVWKDTEGESSYEVRVRYANGTLISATNCEATNVPANITSYNFENCTLTAGQGYLLRVLARDEAGHVTNAQEYPFTVTTNPSGYMILGVRGGVGDTTDDENMDDGVEPLVRWQKAFGSTGYDVSIRTSLGAAVPGCSSQVLDGSYSEVTMVGCDLNLNEMYRVVLLAQVGGNWVAAANSPYDFRHRVGLYISGSGGSYINGQSIKSCAGDGSACGATPYEVNTAVKYGKIRISNDGILTGTPWTGNSPTIGNGILSIEATTLVIDTSGKIEMNGSGYTNTKGPGAGATGAHGGGASHGGLGGIVTGGNQGPSYGNAVNPIDLGSGGGDGSNPTNNLGGSGGGAISISASEIRINNGTIEANGADGGSGACANSPTCTLYRNGGGGGAGGSIKIVTDTFSGASAKITANGGKNAGNTALMSAGGGGRVSFEYRQNSYGSFASLFEAFGARAHSSSHIQSSSAAGTIFYKNASTIGGDPNGHLLIDNNNIPRVQGVETPIPLMVFDSITTSRLGTLVVTSTDIYTHPSNVIDFNLVVAGILNLSVNPNHLKIGSLTKSSLFEWRRQDELAFPTVEVEAGSVVTHSSNGATPLYRLAINATDLIVRGAIDVSGRGYDLESGPGRALGHHGASHGGLGGLRNNSIGSGTRSSVYGSLKTPSELGSGGGGTSTLLSGIGRGGGAVEINATNLQILGVRAAGTKTAGRGEIRADGWLGANSGGAGGSVWIKADAVVAKDATISTNGGNSTNYGAGSGGRISIVYKQDDEYLAGVPKSVWSTSSADTGVEVSAKGGDGIDDGAAGTIFLRKTATGADALDTEPVDALGHLWVFNGARQYEEPTTTVLAENTLLDSIRTDTSGTVLIPSGMNITLPSNSINYRVVAEGDFNPTANLTIADGGYLEWRKISPLQVVGTMTVASLGVVTHSKNDLTRQYALNIQADGFVINGKLDARGKGYAKNRGPGAPAYPLWGAAHAGWGADSNATPIGAGTPYGVDEASAPLELGSGSGCGAGGGVIWLQAPTGKLTLSGTIDASAPNANAACLGTSSLGTGSGGSIYVRVAEIESTKVAGTSPLIMANGGEGGSIFSSGTYRDSYSGSGGRIALEVTTDSVSGGGLKQAINDKNIMAIGGRGSDNYGGAAGTIYLKTDKRYLYVDNDGLPYKDRIETPIPSTALDEIQTLGNGTLVVTEGQMYQLNPSELRGRLVVAGVFSTIDNNLTIKPTGYLQWRRTTPLTLNNLTIENGGQITHTSNLADAQYRFELDAKNLDVQSGAKITATGKGFQSGEGPGGAGSANSGGAYGGSSRVAAAYGSLKNPADLGSGGKDRSGGGNIQLRVTESLKIAGEVSADGNSGPYAGAGGTVFISSGAAPLGSFNLITGYKISAVGGTGTTSSGAGGRIAIHYDVYDGTGGPASMQAAANSANIAAHGGAGDNSGYGAAGTVFYKQTSDAKGYLVVNNNGVTGTDERVSTPLPDGADFDGLTPSPSATLEIKMGETAKIPSDLNYRLILGGEADSGGTLNVKSGGTLEIRRGAVVDEFPILVVESGGRITHSANTSSKNYWAHLDVTSLNVHSGGTIDVSGKGYSAGQGEGRGCAPIGVGIRAGGSYGGMGSPGGSECVGTTYGSIKNPVELGSAGGALSSGTNAGLSGNGGGFVRISSDQLILNGTIVANGTEGPCNDISNCAGSGSGGSVNIVTDEFSGASGSIAANGGVQNAAATEMAAGGGGRIALTVTTTNNFAAVPLTARGGSMVLPKYPAAAGTVFKKFPASVLGSLHVSNINTPYASGVTTELFANDAFDAISIGNGSAAEAQVTGISVRKGATFDFLSSDLDFPLIRAGNARFPGNSPGVHGGNLNIKSGGVFEVVGVEAVVYNDVTIEPGGVLTHSSNRTSLANILNFEANTIEVQNLGKITANGKGYRGSSGLGKGSAAAGLAGGGASFGGLGGMGVSSGVSGALYGQDDLAAKYLGSGGGLGTSNCAGGSGGGGIYLKVGTLTLNSGAEISANGNNGMNAPPTNPLASCRSGGGGSGGAIRIEASTIATDVFSGVSQVFARGGGIDVESANDSFDDGGAGGGGRVYIGYQNSPLDLAEIQTWLSVDGGAAEGGALPALTGVSGTTRVDVLP